jgi:succinate dehydrogenase/fumarate reductase-like Fe-S protein
MSYNARFRVWRGDHTDGELEDFSVEVKEGEVILDIIHRLQATQTPDLAVRWNCKAGKCGSCSAEVNGRPGLMCMTRMSTFTEDDHSDPAACLPGHQGPGDRRVVQLPEGARGPCVRAARGARAR